MFSRFCFLQFSLPRLSWVLSNFGIGDIVKKDIVLGCAKYLAPAHLAARVKNAFYKIEYADGVYRFKFETEEIRNQVFDYMVELIKAQAPDSELWYH